MAHRFTRRLALPIMAGMLLAATSAVHAGDIDTLWVDDDGLGGPASCSGDATALTTIQAAVDGSGPGDTIIVCPGTYTEQVSITGAHEGLTLRASAKYAATIRAPLTPSSGDQVLAIDTVDRVTLQWLTFQVRTTGGCAEYENVIEVDDSDGVRIMGNRITTSGGASLGDCGYGDGIDVDSSRRFKVSSNIVRDFKSDGVTVDGGRHGLILENSIRYLHDGYTDVGDNEGANAIDLDGSYAVDVAQNVVRTGEAYGDGPYLEDGISLDGSHSFRIRGNRVSGVEYGIYVDARDGRVFGNRATDNRKGIDVVDGGNVLRQNDARGNDEDDCSDHTSGGGTSATDNTWEDNVADDDDPIGICTAP